MNIRDIKYKASTTLQQNRNKLVRVFIVMALVSTCASYFGELLQGIFPLIVMIAFIPFGHGYIVSCLKALNHEEDQMDFVNDGFVGFSRFRELFPTYFIYYIFIMIMIIIVGLVSLFIGMMLLSPQTIDQIHEFVLTVQNYGDIDVTTLFNSGVLTMSMLQAMEKVIWLILFVVSMICILYVVYTLIFALTPYVLERYHVKTTQAMKMSADLMKGYKWTLFKLIFSYIGWIILSGLISMVLSMFLNFSILPSLISAIVNIFIYRIHFELSMAIFFEERLLDQSKGDQ